ncbi:MULTISPECIES: NAD+ synthase [Acidianus]|uniref:NH(3)-dependent NAD(+) synthetase n=1 Tax=Candidatus Acidianus copahuensis TaxID=1160895 RepID=A0A031LI75_9CREN|nr:MULTISPECIES: NAD+ synthase [Acidianus]EZQ01817.1 NAD synthetase [Candidatus Acidianus copahuensis]NON63014.1 NAD+ synthase [Acidianus sp. RZ1]
MRIQQVLERLERIDYSSISEYLTLRIKDYIQNAGAKGGILGISGGVDSAVTAYLLSKAVDNFYFLLMPSESTPKEDIQDSLDIITELSAEDKYSFITIDPIVEKFKESVGEDKKVIGNVKARVRMTLLYAFAQKMNYLVIGTGDKSELLLGYFTKYGDGGVDVLPIGDLYKTQVRGLGKFLGVPEKVVGKPSSPALWEGQSAEGELGFGYDLADAVLYLMVEEMKGTEEISAELEINKDLVKKIKDLVISSQHKRLPPEIFRLSSRSINSDWRYPRQWR